MSFWTGIIICGMLKLRNIHSILAIDGRWCIALTKSEKLRKIQEILELKNPQENLYADLLKTMGEEY